MDAEKAGEIGRAFALGYVYGHGVLMAQDEAKWITVHPNGTGANANGDPIKGRPVLIDGETGEVLGGMGGGFNGKHISAVPHHGKKEQHGAQMVIQRARYLKDHPEYKSEGTTSGAQAVTQPKTLKDALKNFRDGLKGQRVTTEHLRQAARMVDESDEGKAYKQNVSKLVQKRKEAEQRIKELKDNYTAEMSKVKEEENNAARDDPKVVEAKRKESELASKDDQVTRALNEKYPGVYDASDIYDAKQRAAYLRDKAKADEVHQEWQSAQQEVFDRQFDAVKPFKERRMRLVQQLNDELSKQASAKREAVKQTAEEAKKLFSSFNTLTPGTADEIARKIRGNATIETKKQMAAAMQCYPQAMTDKFFGEYELGRTVKRGYCNSNFGEIRLSANDYDSSKDGINLGLERTASHETAHAMEKLFPKLRDMEEAYYKERTQGEKSVRLSKLFPGSGYGRDEVTRPDHFFNPYVGKDYSHDAKNAKPHFEIMSTGMEYMIHEPEVFDKDADTRNFILDVLATGGFE